MASQRFQMHRQQGPSGNVQARPAEYSVAPRNLKRELDLEDEMEISLKSRRRTGL